MGGDQVVAQAPIDDAGAARVALASTSSIVS
jgi:hypothetical protein